MMLPKNYIFSVYSVLTRLIMAASILRKICTVTNKTPLQITFSKAKRLIWVQSKPTVYDRPEELNKEDYPSVEISKEDFQYVERLLPDPVVPEPPQHTVYPTPSGWIPPKESALDLPYSVSRNKSHHLPLYLATRAGGLQKLTTVKKIDGDIWKLEADLKRYLEEQTGKVMVTQVHEVARFIRIKGIHLEDVAKFLLEKGF